MSIQIKYIVTAEIDGHEVYRCGEVTKETLKAVEKEAEIIAEKEFFNQSVAFAEFLEGSDEEYARYEALRDTLAFQGDM